MRARLFLAAAATSLLLTGCGGDPADKVDEDPSASPSAAAGATDASVLVGEPVQFRIVEYSDFNPPGQPVPEVPLGCQGDGDCETPRPSGEPSTMPGTSPKFDHLDCATDPVPVVPTPADEPLAACSPPEGIQGTDDYAPAIRYYLGPAVIIGGVVEAEASVPDGQVSWVVDFKFDPAASEVFFEIQQELLGTERQFAIVVNGVVVSAPTVDGLTPNGELQISGNFTEDTAHELAAALAPSS